MKRIFVTLFAIASLAGNYAIAQDEGGSSSGSNGGLFLEPSIYVESGTGQFTSSTGIINFDGKLEGYGVGVKGGVHFADIWFGGLDIMYSMPKFTESNGRFSSNTKNILVGVVTGVQMPIVGLRVWGGFIPYGTLDQDKDRGLQMKFSNPSLFKLGAGMHVSMLSINLEYMWGKYGKSEITNDGSNFATFADAEAKQNVFMLGVSFPLML